MSRPTCRGGGHLRCGPGRRAHQTRRVPHVGVLGVSRSIRGPRAAVAPAGFRAAGHVESSPRRWPRKTPCIRPAVAQQRANDRERFLELRAEMMEWIAKRLELWLVPTAAEPGITLPPDTSSAVPPSSPVPDFAMPHTSQLPNSTRGASRKRRRIVQPRCRTRRIKENDRADGRRSRRSRSVLLRLQCLVAYFGVWSWVPGYPRSRNMESCCLHSDSPFIDRSADTPPTGATGYPHLAVSSLSLKLAATVADSRNGARWEKDRCGSGAAAFCR